MVVDPLYPSFISSFIYISICQLHIFFSKLSLWPSFSFSAHSGSLSLSLCLYIYIYICISVYPSLIFPFISSLFCQLHFCPYRLSIIQQQLIYLSNYTIFFLLFQHFSFAQNTLFVFCTTFFAPVHSIYLLQSFFTNLFLLFTLFLLYALIFRKYFSSIHFHFAHSVFHPLFHYIFFIFLQFTLSLILLCLP